MISSQTQSQLAHLLYSILTNQNYIEQTRLQLSVQPSFHPQQAFKYLDRLSQSFLSSKDIRQFLKLNRKPCSLISSQLLISQYDKDLDGKLSYQQFANLVLSRSNVQDQPLKYNRPENKKVSLQVEFLILSILTKQLAAQQDLEQQKQKLATRSDFNLYQFFQQIDTDRKGFLSSDNLLRFLRRFKFNLNSKQVENGIKRISKYGKIFMDEFVSEILPSQPHTRKLKQNLDNFPQKNIKKLSDLSPADKIAEFATSPSPRVDSSRSPQRPAVRYASPLRKVSPVKQSHEGQDHRMPMDQINKVEIAQFHFQNKRNFQVQDSKIQKKFHNSKNSSFNSPLRYCSLPLDSFQSSHYFSPVRQHISSSSQNFLENPVLSTIKQFFPNSSSKTDRDSPSFSTPIKRNRYFNPIRENDINVESLLLEFMSISMDQQDQTVQILYQFIKILQEIERKRIDLSFSTDFNLIDAFWVFDTADSGFITPIKFVETLQYFGLEIKDYQISLFFDHFCQLTNSGLKFSDFSLLFTPKDPEFAVMLRNKEPFAVPVHSRRQVFKPATLELFLDTLQLLFYCQVLAFNLREKEEIFSQLFLYKKLAVGDFKKISLQEFHRCLSYYKIQFLGHRGTQRRTPSSFW